MIILSDIFVYKYVSHFCAIVIKKSGTTGKVWANCDEPVMQISQPDKTFAAINQTNNNKQKY